MSAGRPGEVATFSPDALVWDALCQGPVGQWPQFKTYKMKLLLLLAGFDPNLCPLNALACAYAAGNLKISATTRTK